jgi:hypothetical protein
VPANSPDYTYAFAINNRGEVLGEIGNDTVIWSPDGSAHTLVPPTGHTFGHPADLNDEEVLTFGTLRRADGSVEDLPGFSGVAISRAGKVLGQGPDGPVVWERDGTARSLPITGYGYGHGYDINDAGWVAGMVGINDVNSLAVWRPDGTLIVGSAGLRDHFGAQGEGINNLGEVVGFSLNRAVYWSEAAGLVDLQTRLDASGAGWTLASAMGINDAGQIIATAGRDGGTHTYAVLLTPVPEPSLALAGLAVLAVMAARRRRGT